MHTKRHQALHWFAVRLQRTVHLCPFYQEIQTGLQLHGPINKCTQMVQVILIIEINY